MRASEFRFILVPFTEGGEVRDKAVELDEAVFSAAIEGAHFYGVRNGILSPLTSPCGSIIVPRWSRNPGQPYIEGITVQIIGETGDIELSVQYQLSYFEQHVRSLIQQSKMTASLNVSGYHVCAVPNNTRGACETAGSSISVEEIKRPLDLRKASLQSLLNVSTCSPDSDTHDSPGADIPVFIAEDVLSGAVEHARETGANEAGGILAGYLCRDNNDSMPSDIFVVITSRILAPVAKEDTGATRIRFSHETWAYFRESLKTRNTGEAMIGWYHSHPVIKKISGAGSQCNGKKKCGSSVFFSSADINVHRVAFSQAFNTALVIGYTACAMTRYGLFGWRWGNIIRRDVHVVGKKGAELRKTFM